MSWSLFTQLTDSNLTKHCEKKKDFRYQCKICQRLRYYIHIPDLKDHLLKEHKEIYESGQVKYVDRFWKHFKLTNQNIVQCMTCEKTFLQYPTDCQDHIKEHETNEHGLINYIKPLSFWKYFEEIEDEDFSAKCTLCEQIISLTMTTEIQDHLKWHGIKVKSPEKFKSVKTASWELFLENHEYVKKCFTDQKNFRATCNYCKSNILCIESKKLKTHMMEKHYVICHLETQKYKEHKILNQPNWKAMRYTDEKALEIKCIICNIANLNESSIKYHVQHTAEELQNFKMFWIFKYIIQEGDFATCKICRAEAAKFSFQLSKLKQHIQRCKHLPPDEEDRILEEWAVKQETDEEYDPAGS